MTPRLTSVIALVSVCGLSVPSCAVYSVARLASHALLPSQHSTHPTLAINSPDQKLKFVVNAEEEPAWDIFGDVMNNMEVFYDTEM